MLRKNVASQFVHIAGVNVSTGAIVSGASWTMRRCLDGTFAAGGATLTEDGTTGFYKVALTQADTNGNDIGYFFTATNCVPVTLNAIATAADPTDGVRLGLTALPNAAANAAGGLPISSAGALDLDEMNVDIEAIQTSTAGLTFTGAGKVDASVRDWVGDTIPARSVTGVPKVDVQDWTGTAVSTPATAGIPEVNVKNINNVATTPVTTVKAVQGLTTADVVASVTGAVGSVTGAVGSVTANVNADVKKINGTTVNGNGGGTPWGP